MKKIDAISYFGNTVKVAEALGIAQSAVSQWNENIPQRRAFELQHITNGALKAEFPVVVPKQPTVRG